MEDFDGDIEWYNSTVQASITSWKLVISSMDLDHYNLLEAPPAPEPTNEMYDDEFNDDHVYKDAVYNDTDFTSYAHFNSGYPFIGVDEYVASLVEEDIKYFRPDVKC